MIISLKPNEKNLVVGGVDYDDDEVQAINQIFNSLNKLFIGPIY